jgi:hypothetical protein
VRVVPVAGAFVQTGTRRNIDLAPDNRLDAGGFSGLVKLDNAVHHAVVGDSQAAHTQLFSAGHQFCNRTHAVKQAVFRVDVKVGKHHIFPGEIKINYNIDWGFQPPILDELWFKIFPALSILF